MTAMTKTVPMQGELQIQVMSALWREGSGSVEAVRRALPARHRGAYNTIQTVLNRLAERGLLTRVEGSRGLIYEPTMTEAEYVSRSVAHTLASASAPARQAALAALLGGMTADDIAALRRLSAQVARDRPR